MVAESSIFGHESQLTLTVIYASELVLWVGVMCAGLNRNLPKAIQRRSENDSIPTGNEPIDPPLETEAEIGVDSQ